MFPGKEIYLLPMGKYASQIIHWFVLLVIATALIGVNVTRFSCSHAGVVYWEVKILPVEKKCLCGSGCPCCRDTRMNPCENTCHAGSQHVFYKITEISEIERHIQLNPLVCEIPVVFSCVAGVVFFIVSTVYTFITEVTEFPPSQESLCIYRC